MSISLQVNGVNYQYPESGDSDWGSDGTNWAQAVTNSLIQQTGGTFTLTGELDFGPAFGLKTLYLKSETASPATSGVIRLANSDTIEWRNALNTANVVLSLGLDNKLDVDGQTIVTIGDVQTLSSKTLVSPVITNPDIQFAAYPATLVWATAGSGQIGGFTALTANKVITTNSSSIPTLVSYLPISSGGTNNPSLAVDSGRVIYADGAKLTSTGIPSTPNQVLQIVGATPGWGKLLDTNVYKKATAPTSPVQGDLWYDTVTTSLKSYNGSGWEGAGAVNALSDLTDVLITTPSTNEILKWDGTKWINGPDVSGGSPLWGSLVGTLSNQTDLQTALNAKQPLDGDLTSIAGLVGTSGFLKKAGTNSWTLDASTYSPSTHNHDTIYEPANANIQAHVISSLNPHNVTKAQVGLGNCDNTSDADKPISTFVQAALNAKSDVTHTHTLDNLSDVTLTSPVNGQVLKFNSVSGVWENSGTSGTSWGSIAGTLSNQTDLQTALNGKQPIDGDLTAIAALAGTSGFLKKTGTDSWTLDTATYALSSHNHTGVYEPANANIQAHISSTLNPHNVTKVQVGLGNVEDLKVNLVGSTAPTSSDDSGDGYAIGSRWFDTANDVEYVCLDASVGASVWTATTSGVETNRISGTNTQTSDYTLVLSDENKIIKMNLNVQGNLTIPPNADVPFAIGTTIHAMWYGLEQPTIVAGSGVTVLSAESLLLSKQFAVATMIKIDTNEWVVAGYMETL